jgi:hypothetical protein
MSVRITNGVQLRGPEGAQRRRVCQLQRPSWAASAERAVSRPYDAAGRACHCSTSTPNATQAGTARMSRVAGTFANRFVTNSCGMVA